MIILRTNWLNIIGRLVMLLLLLVAEIIFIHFIKTEKYKPLYIMYLLVFLHAFIFLLITISLCGVIKVNIDRSLGMIKFKVFFQKHRFQRMIFSIIM